ncbi:MAG: hypothetical protein EA412_09420 [Chitinophagaceae bacterium]|nr:MAG: hypothetical protein EA412_09420 [Chitinophagaceae bacterium]
MRRVVIIALLVLGILTFLFVLVWQIRSFVQSSDPWKAMPHETPVIIQLYDNELIFGESHFEYRQLSEQIPILQNLITQTTTLNDYFGITPDQAIIGLDKISVHKADFFFLSGNKDIKPAIQHADSLFKTAGYSVRNRVFRDVQLFDVVIESENTSFTYAFTEGIFIFSFTPFLVESCIVQLRTDATDILTTGFERSLDLRGKNAPLSLHIQSNYMHKLSSIFFKSGSTGFLNSFSFLGDFLTIDVHFQKNALLANGYSYSNPGSGNFINAFRGEAADMMKILSVVPDNTAFYKAFSTESFDTYTESLSFSDTSANYMPYFTNWVGNEWLFGISESLRSGQDTENNFLVVASRDVDLSLQALEELHFVLNDDRDNLLSLHRGIPVYQLAVSFLNDVFGPEMPQITDPFYFQLGEQIVFTNSVSQAQSIIDRYNSDNTLDKNLHFYQFSRQISSYSNATFYLNFEKSFSLLESLSNNNFSEFLRANRTELSSFSDISAQFNSFRDLHFLNIYIPYDTLQSAVFSNKAWQTRLDAKPVSTPEIVINHNNNEKEIFLSDSEHNIYLINRAGDILWKRNLGERIIGDVYQMDIYNNGRLQYLFTTTTRIFLIDRNGNNVTNFPIRLPKQATAGITLTDYENDKNYRFFVPCREGSIYGYSRDGGALPGWSPNNINISVNQPIIYKRFNGRDYLISANSEGNIAFLNRRGELRRPVISLNSSFISPFVAIKKDNQLSMISLDTASNLITVSSKGQTDTLNLSSQLNAKSFAVNNYENPVIVIADSFSFEIHDIAGGEVISREFQERILPESLRFYNNYILFNSADKSIIYAFDLSGQLLNDFPLPGYGNAVIARFAEGSPYFAVIPEENGFISTYRIR